MLIDVHAHQFPRRYAEIMARRGRPLRQAAPGPEEIERRLGLMDEAGVDRQVLSPASAVPYFENEADAIEAARMINDGYAELTHRLPERLMAYVSLPMPHVEASLREMERGLDELGMAGVALTCSILDQPATQERFEPLYREMDRRDAVLFFHPAQNGICSPLIRDCGFTTAAGASMEDTAVVLHMIASGIPSRYPNIRMIVPHLGGLIPSLLSRLDNQVPQVHRNLSEPPSATAKRLWYDTVGHGSHPALRCACEALGADRLVPGSDYPILLAFESYAKTFSYIREAALPDGAAERILHRNAPALFGLAR